MVEQSEILTIRILGDSSGLQAELAKVERDVSRLKDSFAVFNNLGNQVAQAIGRVGGLQQPLQRVSNALSRIQQQLQQLSQTPVTLNVAPAIGSLAQLSAAIASVAQQLQQLSAVGGAPRGPSAGPVRGFATGGLVTGTSGVDRVPAFLSAGEFVLRREAVQGLGLPFLNQLNQAPGARSTPRTPVPTSERPPAPQTTNNFGGITVEVREATDVNELIRDLRLNGFRLRNRRG